MEKQKLGQSRQIKALKNISPIAWPHINLVGKYNFKKINIPLSFSKINELVKHDVLAIEVLEDDDSIEISL